MTVTHLLNVSTPGLQGIVSIKKCEAPVVAVIVVVEGAVTVVVEGPVVVVVEGPVTVVVEGPVVVDSVTVVVDSENMKQARHRIIHLPSFSRPFYTVIVTEKRM